ncbi:uncharacterized protein NECHADRAFT_87232 [Fusarium vanettenii 77-13-4]|uniref:Peptidase S33 tripeptidyl aminopeptidase-like C-terminal domain-containing protein n=1 Tax=Fusarium vanettenii (strain ATCC MYA-4622 / CBS 123669 / FGSC 9596 / NRRL 45880 / 77-13-4) TaxID=660122 RepID=C7ZIR1_FUSV7|nr:uncharacterized protein NECHADRAFT_87232 [Fusarium vanettenii 77-13-4]EEU36072.1 hypothetical protein NECHADRAFT_87232 [Fusarium vanettenii 77-13-4]
MTGPLMDHLDTIQVVKDLEAVRAALGNEKMNWLGMSYGTMIDTQYDEASMLLSEATTYETTLKRFFNWFETGNKPTCVLSGRNVENIGKIFLLKQPRSPSRHLGAAQFAGQTSTPRRFALEHRFSYSKLQLDATEGDATALSTYLATGDAFGDSMLFTFLATTCNDFPTEAEAFADLWVKQIEASVFAPLTGGASATYMVQSACIGWKHKNRNRPKMVKIRGTPKVLVVNGIYDPSTSYAWAMGVSRQFGEFGVLLTRNGAGHISYHIGGETSRAMDRYLVNLTVPAPGTVFDS